MSDAFRGRCQFTPVAGGTIVEDTAEDNDENQDKSMK